MKKLNSILLSTFLGVFIVLTTVSPVLAASKSKTSVTTVTTSTTGTVVPVALTQADAGLMNSVLASAQQSAGEAVTTPPVLTLIPDPNKAVNGQSSNAPLTFLSMNGNNLEFNVTSWLDATTQSQTNVLTAFIDSLQKSGISSQDQQQVISTMEAQDSSIQQMMIPIVLQGTKANIYGGMKFIAPFLPVLDVITGIGVVVIMLLLVLSSVVDIVFIGLPIFRNQIQEKKSMFLISHDAQLVVKQSESEVGSSGSFGNVYLMYIKKRIVTYLLISFCILWLVFGEVGGIISFIFNLTGGGLSSP